jgi:hypothetical protein
MKAIREKKESLAHNSIQKLPGGVKKRGIKKNNSHEDSAQMIFTEYDVSVMIEELIKRQN